MRSKPKGSAPKGSARETSRAARSDPAGSRPRPRRSPAAPRADDRPTGRKPAPGLDPGGGPNCGALKHIGGSQSDEWNDRLAAETVEAMPQLACETRDQKMDAALQGLAGIAPQDELEGMMAAQLIAAHAAAMDCYRCAAKEERSGERHDHLNQATRLSRAFATLLNALHRYRRNGRREQKFAKQPSAGTAAPPLAPTGVESAKQPHARETPPERATRLDGLRQIEERPDRELQQHKFPNWGSLSDEELAAMTRTGPEEQRARATIVLVDRIESARERAAAATAAAKAMPVQAPTKPAKQPPPPAPDLPSAPAQAPVAAPAVEPGWAPGPAARATANTKSAKQPPAMSFARARELMGPGTPDPTAPGRMVYTLPLEERDAILAALQEETRRQMEAPSHGTIAPVADPTVRIAYPGRDVPGAGPAQWPLSPARRT